MLSVLPDSVGALPQGARAHGERSDALCSKRRRPLLSWYFDPVLVHRQRTYLELVRLLARRGMVRFTLEPKEKVGLFAVRQDDGLKQRLIVDARRSNLRFRPCPNVNLFSGGGFSKLEIDPDVMPAAWFGITECFRNMLIPEWRSDFFSLIPVTATEVGIEGSTLLQNGCKVSCSKVKRWCLLRGWCCPWDVRGLCILLRA